MTWPSPTETPLPPPAPPTGHPEPDRPAPGPLRSVPSAAWVALAGGTLVLLAAAIVVVGNWDAIGRGVRLGGLTLVSAGLILASERLRRLVPTTASIVAHVGTFLIATVGVATMSMLGVTWPGCLAVGGVMAAAATELQRSRWPRGAFGAGQVAGIALASTGVAALTGATGGVVAVIAAAGLLAAGASRRAAGLALLAVSSPALAALADAGIGAGSFERAGLVGERLGWSGPAVGFLAAGLLGTVAVRRRNNALMALASTAPVLGMVTGLAAIDGSAIAWFCLPGFVVIAAESAWWALPSDRWRGEIRGVIDALAAILAVAVVVAGPILAGEALATHRPGAAAIPLAVALLALVLSAVRLRATSVPHLADLASGAVATAVIAVAIALDAPALATATVAVAATAAAAWTSRTFHPLAVYGPGCWAAVSIAKFGAPGPVADSLVAIALLAALAGVAIALRARIAGRNRWSGPPEMIGLIIAVAITAGWAVRGATGPAVMLAAAIAATGIMLTERRFVGAASPALLATGVGAVVPAAVEGQLGLLWIGCGAAAAGFAAASWVYRGSRPGTIAAIAGGAATTLTAATAMIDLPVDAERFFVLALVTVVALTGLVAAVGRTTALDGAAATAGVLLVAAGVEVQPSWASAGWTVAGLQMIALGSVHRLASVRWLGALVGGSGLVSWWFTSGWHATVAGWLEPADIRFGDVWMAAMIAAALVAGRAARRSGGIGSWLAYGPSIALAAIWLLPTISERSTVWALPLALATGAVAIAAGGRHRLAGPLVGGLALTAATVLVALGSDIAAVPAWVWFAMGGLVLLGAAVLIERHGRDGISFDAITDRWR